jgi:PEP-CTERM motif
MTQSKILLFLASVILVCGSTLDAKADTVSFSSVAAFQGGSITDLAANPGATLYGSTIDFRLDIHGATPAAGFNTLQITFAETGKLPVIQTFDVPLFDGLPADYSQLFSFQPNNPTFGGTLTTLTVTLLSGASGPVIQSQTYTFNSAQPVPEPATVSFLVLGMGGLLSRKYRRRLSFRNNTPPG